MGSGPQSQEPTSHTPTLIPPPSSSTDPTPDSQSVILIRRRYPNPSPPLGHNAPPTAHPPPGPPQTPDKNRSAQPSPGALLNQAEGTRQQRHRQTSTPPLASSRSPPPILNDADRENLQQTRCSSASEFPKRQGSTPTDPSLKRPSPLPTTVATLSNALRRPIQLGELAIMYGLGVEELNAAAQHPEDRPEKRAAITELATLKTVEKYLIDGRARIRYSGESSIAPLSAHSDAAPGDRKRAPTKP